MIAASRGKIPCGQKVVIYGPEGIGKTTLASQFPSPVFLDTEGSTRNFDVLRMPAPTSWEMLKQEVQAVVDHVDGVKKVPGMADVGTLVVDTADWAERMCNDAVCTQNKKPSIEAFGYGKGYIYAMEEFQKLLDILEQLTARGVNVIFTAHAHLRKVELPDEAGAYDKWELKCSKQISPMLKEWADLVLFCNYKTIIVSDDKGKGKAHGGKRVMYTSHHPCWDAKNRHGLEPELPMEMEPLSRIFPTENPKKAEEMDVDSMDGIDPRLAELMARDKILPHELMISVGFKGFPGITTSTRVQQYPDGLIEKVLLPNWEKIARSVEEDRQDLPF